MRKETSEKSEKNTGVGKAGVRGHGEPDFRKSFILVCMNSGHKIKYITNKLWDFFAEK